MKTRRIPRLAACLFALCVMLAGRADGEEAPAGEAPPVGAEPEPETEAAPLDARIKAAIEKGIAYLRTQQRPNGSWGDLGSKAPLYTGGAGTPHQHPLGPTAMALYAMLKCDVPATDPTVAKGLAWLEKAKIDHNTSAYELSASLLAVTAVANPFKKGKDSAAASAKVRLTGQWRTKAASLQTALMSKRAPGGGGWRYTPASVSPGGLQDVSSTMLAILALASADRCGLPSDPTVYGRAASYVLTLQEEDGPEVDRVVYARRKKSTKPAAPGRYSTPPPPGAPKKDRARGFHYSVDPSTKDHDKNVTGARTACGIGTLALAKYALDSAGARDPKAPSAQTLEQAIYDGLAWLAENFSSWSNPGAGNRQIYYLYCVERAMDLVGAERLGENLWYVEMVDSLLGEQAEKGFWDTKDQQVGDRNPVIDTAYALLFLRRSTKDAVPTPVVTGGE
jgi:hypothetical protein